MWKNLAEPFVLTKTGYGNVMVANIPRYLIKQLQQVQNATASSELHKYTIEHKVISLGWLLVIERMNLIWQKWRTSL